MVRWLLWVVVGIHTVAATNGVTISTFNNTAWVGPPSRTIQHPTLDINLTASTPMSAEVTGQLTYPSPGNYTFDCTFPLGHFILFVWIGDHLVCQTGVYSPKPSSWDGAPNNPIQVPKEALTVVVRIRMYTSGASSGPAGYHKVANSNIACNPPNQPPCDLKHDVKTVNNCAEWCNQTAGCVAFGESTQSGCYLKGVARPVESSGSGDSYIKGDVGSAVGVTVLWGHNGATPTHIPSSALVPTLPHAEVQRRVLQDSLIRGWGPWMHSTVLTLTSLPSGLKITTALCQLSTHNCLSSTTIDRNAPVRVGMHAYDRSYVQMYVAFNSVNVSMEYQGGDELRLLVTVITCPDGCKDYILLVTGAVAWGRDGTITSPAAGQLYGQFWGLPDIMVYGAPIIPPNAVPHSMVGDNMMTLSLSTTKPVVVTTGKALSVSTVRSLLSAARDAEIATYHKYGDLAATKEAVQAAVMWNYIYVPVEAGPLLPVSRGWNFARGGGPDWTYVIFDWDNIFASYMAALDAKDIAYSNFIQVIKSKTAAGFIPNWRAGGMGSVDRTEPPIGAKVLLAMYEKYHDDWLVELLFQDLLDWNNWVWRRRRLSPLNLICLGSDLVQGYPDGAADHMQGARFESGLDNSPMYDGNLFDASTNHMQLYDVGMTSMVVSEADALAQLATVVGRTDDSKLLKDRAAQLRSLMQRHLWDTVGSTYTNLLPNGTFYRRISPTSFYSMLANASTDEQATQQVKKWLLNPDKFCVSLTWPSGVNDTCYWGLPSINAADPAYPPLGYWRGYVWGPMAQLTYWSLQNYDHLPVVRTARKALCRQMTSMMMNQWNTHRHICENFNPHKDGKDCTGDTFYHWGALAGLISLIEAAHY